MTPETKSNGKVPRRPCILVADDAPDILLMLQIEAQRRGWDCETATTAQEIIDKVTAHCAEGGRCFDALVLDVHYADGPRITGVQAVRSIRKQFSHIPVIFITGFDTYLVKNEALTVGQEVIRKPFTAEYVLDRVAVWIAWAANVASGCYAGPERRERSVNRSGHMRRATDRPVELNRRVASAAQANHAD